jgi:hypothetical protein
MRAPLLLALVSVAGCTAGSILGETGSGGDVGDPGGPPDAGVAHPQPDGPPVVEPDAPPSGPSPTFDVSDVSRVSVLSIAEASVGYTYWWGHGNLGGGMAGTCTGSCPSCSHTGPDGADCSGFVSKAWMLPGTMPIVGADEHPYSTYTFTHETTHWSNISRADVVGGDAMVYNVNGSGHVFLYEKDDPWGQMWTFEARGCAYGIVHNIRTAGAQFGAIRREGL